MQPVICRGFRVHDVHAVVGELYLQDAITLWFVPLVICLVSITTPRW